MILKRNAFTLVELLVVVAIISLLVAILIPSLQSARALTYRAICASNLRHIHQAFQTAQGQAVTDGEGHRSLYPNIYGWPSVPQIAAGQADLFWCPAGPDGDEIEAVGEFTVKASNPDGGDKLITFEPTNADPWRRVFDRGDYWEYWFDDGKMFDLSPNGVDYVFHVTKDPPRRAVFHDVPHNTWFITSILRGDEPLEGWEDLRTNETGDSFEMDGGGTCNYGFNAALSERTHANPGTIAVLDYNKTIANGGEDMTAYINDGARHLGRCNVMYTDGAVKSCDPLDIDPLIDPDPWLPERQR